MSTDATTVLAVCVNWNGKEVLPATLASLMKSDYPRLNILVVDNASTDGSLERVPPSVKTLRLPENLGYGAALNRGIRSLGGKQPGAKKPGPAIPDYFLILNNDLMVEDTMVKQLVEFAEATGKGIYGPKILRYQEPDRLEAAWGKISWSHVLARFHGKGARDGPRWNSTRSAPLLLGSALLMAREIFSDVGPFDESFFLYHEEVDFLYRAGQKGYPIYHCPFARAWHRGAQGTRDRPLQKVFWTRRNAVYFLRKHRAGPLKWSYFFLTLLASLTYNLAWLRWPRAGTICRGIAAGFKLESRVRTREGLPSEENEQCGTRNRR